MGSVTMELRLSLHLSQGPAFCFDPEFFSIVGERITLVLNKGADKEKVIRWGDFFLQKGAAGTQTGLADTLPKMNYVLFTPMVTALHLVGWSFMVQYDELIDTKGSEVGGSRKTRSLRKQFLVLLCQWLG